MKSIANVIRFKMKGLSVYNRWPFVLLFFSVSVFAIALVTFFDTKAYKDAKMMQSSVIVIDAGHGGDDPGKVSADGVCEKDVNLAIAKKLQASLVKRGISVEMTREDDNDLSAYGATNKKKSDMNKRVEKINSSNAVYLISIHQNSYTDSKVKGLQVFYYGMSEKGKGLAARIQDTVKEKVDSDNNRFIKEGNEYYILRRSKCPGVIVECGFLSNSEETLKLTDEEYQFKLAEAIADAIEKELEKK